MENQNIFFKKIRILVALKESAGDIFLITGVVDSLKKKYPNSNIYIACEKKYFDILEDNPNIKGLLEFHQSMYDYRAYTKWAMNNNTFDIVYCPAICTQVVPSNWLNGKYAVFLGRFYANMCDVPYDKTWIKIDEGLSKSLPAQYITVQSQTKTDPKDYDNIEGIIKRIKNYPVVHIGETRDKKIDIPNIIDIRGQTTPSQLAGVIKNSSLHIGLDSFPMHLAGHFGTPSIILFGGTLPEAAVNPEYKNMTIIETQERGPCITSCHLLKCEVKNHGGEKCINNIPLDTIIEQIGKIIGIENVIPPESIKISSYMIIKDGIKYGFPFEEAILAAGRVSDEVVVVDGGSTDGTKEKLLEIQKKVQEGLEIKTVGALHDAFGNPNTDNHALANSVAKLKLFEHPWDMDNPTLFGDEKTYARQQCTGNWLIQLDADEIIQEPQCGAIKELIKNNSNTELLDIPVINFYNNKETIRLDQNPLKWRISRNNPNIIHGIHAEARQFDSESMKVIMDKNLSDSCEFLYSDSLKIVPHKAIISSNFMQAHYKVFNNTTSKEFQEEYINELKKLVLNNIVIYHYSWLDLDRKHKNGEFWDQSWHGKHSWTHNSSKDIKDRIENNKEKVIFIGNIL